LKKDAKQPVCITVDQINCRFSENGTEEQEYADVKLFVTKIKNGKQQFLDGEYEGGMPTVTCAFNKGLTKGEYLVLFSVEFLSCHPLKRIILTTYCEDDVQFARLDERKYGFNNY